jgi:ribonuclease D
MEPSSESTTHASAVLRYTVVATAADFQTMLSGLSPVARAAIDIEADSLYHYFEKVCLIQISTDTETYVLDSLAVRDLSPLAPLMSSPVVEKIFHAAGYDLRCLRRDYGFTFAALFDTHIAAQLLGYDQLGLSALMEKLLGVKHSKRRQRDDWSRRPLNAEQLEYAAMDTHHLLRLRDVLEEQLREKDRLSWAREEFVLAAGAQLQEKEFDPEAFRRIKGSRGLSRQQLAVLRALYLLRDRHAREMDLPPFKVLGDAALIDLARHPIASPRELFQRPGISFRVARKLSPEILRATREASSENPSDLTFPLSEQWRPPTPQASKRLESLKIWRQSKSLELELPVGVVIPGRLLELLAASPPSDLKEMERLQGIRRWQMLAFGPEILEILRRPERA